MWSLIIGFTVLLACITNAFAQTCEDKLIKNGMVLPPYLIDELFTPSKIAIPIFLPLPSNTCSLKTKLINIIDEKNNAVGTMTVQEEWTGKFTQGELVKLRKNKSIKDHLAIKYETYMISKKWHEILTTQFLLNIFDPSNNYQQTYNLKLVYGTVKLNPNYTSDWSRFAHINKHWAAKNIEYQDLLKIYKSQKHFIIQIPQNINNSNSFVFPKVDYHFKVLSNKYNEIFYIRDLITLQQANPLPEKAKNLPLVIISNTRTDSMAYNAITTLYAQGFKNILWFNDSTLKWNNRKLWIPNISKENLITAEKLKDLYLQKNVTLIDVRPKETFGSVHIPGSINLPFKTVTASQYMTLMANIPKIYHSKMTPGRDSFPYLPFTDLHPKSNIVVISHNILSLDEAEMAQIMLLGRGYKNIKVLSGGLAAWDNYTKWKYPNLKL